MVEIFFEMIVDLQQWLNGEQFLSFFLIRINLNASQYDNTIFSLNLFSCLK